MIHLLCQEVRPLLGALADGELAGADMLRTTGHLEQCSACAHEYHTLRRVGDLLRESSPETPLPALAGLADGVVTRARAEAEQSWGGIYHRAVDSWHWAIVGAGSVAGTAMVTLIASAVLFFGTPPEHGRSLSAVMSNRYMQPAEFEVVGNRRWAETQPEVVYTLFLGSEREMVSWLSDYLSRPGVTYISHLPDEDRRYVELLGVEITKRRSGLSEIKLGMTTTVSASSP